MRTPEQYAQNCIAGRNEAVQAIRELREGGNRPKLLWAIRREAADESGHGAGFLCQIAEELT